jgi:hypothetical protein
MPPGETSKRHAANAKGAPGSTKASCKTPADSNAPSLVDDGRDAVVDSNAYKGCPDKVKKKIKSKKFTKKQRKEINEVLGKLKPLMKCKNQPLKKIARVNRSISHDDKGHCYADTTTMGEWFDDKGTLVLTDQAGNGSDFTDSKKQFRGTAAHEMTHALTNEFDPRTCKAYKNYKKNPLMKKFMKAAGWNKTGSKLKETAKNKAPSDYAKTTNPNEDMSESVMFYLYEPDKLKNASPERYKVIDDLFKGK